MPKQIRKVYELDKDVFAKLRQFYEMNKDMRHHKVVVCRNGKPVFCLGYVRNRAVNVNPDSPMVQMKLSNFCITVWMMRELTTLMWTGTRWCCMRIWRNTAAIRQG